MNKKKVALLLMAASTVGAVTLSQETVYATENSQWLTGGETPTAQMARATQRGQVVNVQTNLRLREQPNTNSKVLGYLNNGETFDIKGINGEWYQIQTNTKTGYVHKDYVKEISGSNDNNNSNNNSNNTTSTSKGQVVNVSSNLRIRQTPSSSGSIVGYLINGQTFNIKGKSGDWYNIDANGKVGYVHKDYVKELSSSSSTPTPSPEPPKDDTSTMSEKGQVVNISSSLRIRQSASTSSSVVGYLYNGDKFDIKGKNGDWYYINANGKVGYVHKDYVKVLSSDNTTTTPPTTTPEIAPEVTPTPPSQDSTVPAPENPQEAETGTVYNVSTNLRMRSKASTDGQVLAYILPGEKVTIKGSTGSWYYIEYKGKLGYAHKDYIKKGEVTTPAPTPTPSPEEKPNEGVTSSKYEEVLAVMKAQVGSPYVYGAAGEIVTQSLIDSLRSKYSAHSNYDLIGSQYIDNGYRGFDCSGLMYWSFKQVGITLGRNTYAQMNNGVGVSASEAKPGDLLFRKSGTHVGMYLGNNQWLEAPNSGKLVRIVDVPWNDIGTIRRVIQ